MTQNKQRGALIRQARLRRKWTQAQLAEQCGVKKNTVYRWEAGTLPPCDDNKQKLHRLLGIALSRLITG